VAPSIRSTFGPDGAWVTPTYRVLSARAGPPADRRALTKLPVGRSWTATVRRVVRSIAATRAGRRLRDPTYSTSSTRQLDINGKPLTAGGDIVVLTPSAPTVRCPGQWR